MGGARIDLAKDFRDLLHAFVDRKVRFLVVGAYALAVLGRPRATADLDVWIEPTADNAEKAYARGKVLSRHPPKILSEGLTVHG